MTRVELLFPIVFFVVVLAAGLVAPMSAGARPERVAIRLSCLDADQAALCRALIQALALAAPGTVIVRVPAGQERPLRPKDLGVALMIEADPLRARLRWQGAEGAASAGPALALPADAKDLIAASPGLQKRLAALTASNPSKTGDR